MIGILEGAMKDPITENTQEALNVEEIMEAIRQKIAADKGVDAPPGEPVSGGMLPAEFYEHFHEARLAHNRIQPQVLVTPVSIPVIGNLLQPLRQKLHELVLYYVNQLAANQIRVNAHILNALEILSQEMERIERDNDRSQ
jgi:hypothetical protein